MDVEKMKHHKGKSHKQKKPPPGRNLQHLLDALYNGQVDLVKDILFSSGDHSTHEKKTVALNTVKDLSVLPISCVKGAVSGSTSQQDESAWIECIRLLSLADIPIDAQDREGTTALHVAVQCKRYQLVKELAQLCSRLDSQNSDGQTCLHIAIMKGDTAMVEHLLEFLPTQTLDMVDKLGRSPLYLSLLNGSCELFECLLSRGCSPNGTASDGRPIIFHVLEKNLSLHLKKLVQHGVALETVNGFTAVHFAACQENAENIRALSSILNPELLHSKDKEGKTPLMYVAMTGLDQNMKFLLQAKIGILQQDNEGKSALHYTATNTHRGCVDLLCKYDPNVISLCDLNGNTPGHDAIMAQNETVLKAILDHGLDVDSADNEKHTLVHWATVYNSHEGLQELIKKGALVNCRDITGASPLHYACQLEDEKAVIDARNQILKLLLVNSASVEAVDNSGRRPIHWAGSSGNKTGLLLLAKKGVDINAGTCSENLTALHLAASQGYSECVQVLVENSSASVNVLDSRGCSPLLYACAVGDSKSVATLLAAGANPNEKGVDGKRPLHCAASQKVVQCLPLLVEAGAEITLQTNQGDTPLHEAASAGQGDCVKYLLEKGCSPDVQNKFGAAPLHYATAENHKVVIENLVQSGAKVNIVFPTGTENNYVSPLDIALRNENYPVVKLLQCNGGRTGHSIAQNAAITIQHKWKAYKERKKKNLDGTEQEGKNRSRRSTLSDSVSVRDEKEAQNCRDDNYSLNEKITDQNENELPVFDNEEAIQEGIRSLDLNSPDPYCEGKGNELENYEADTIEQHLENAYGSIAQEFAIDQITMEMIEHELAESKKAVDGMKQLLLYAESLREDFNKAAKNAKGLVDSEDFKAIKSYNQRMRTRRTKTQVKRLAPLKEV